MREHICHPCREDFWLCHNGENRRHLGRVEYSTYVYNSEAQSTTLCCPKCGMIWGRRVESLSDDSPYCYRWLERECIGCGNGSFFHDRNWDTMDVGFLLNNPRSLLRYEFLAASQRYEKDPKKFLTTHMFLGQYPHLPDMLHPTAGHGIRMYPEIAL